MVRRGGSKLTDVGRKSAGSDCRAAKLLEVSGSRKIVEEEGNSFTKNPSRSSGNDQTNVVDTVTSFMNSADGGCSEQ